MSLRYSVIIPIYNAEDTLHRCIDSLLIQARDDVEIILVNDGSPDGCEAICKEYENEYPCIRYIAKENGGVSTARNAGLDIAKGTYITFVDSDDYVAADYFSILDAVRLKYDYDLIYFSNYSTDGNSVSARIHRPYDGRNRETIISKIIDSVCNKKINGPVTKVYKREIIERYDICFPIGASVAEDRAFNIAYSTHINSYCVSNKPIYYVSTENEHSLSRKKHSDLANQFEITGSYARDAIKEASIPEKEKQQYYAALNFGICRGIYKTAKDMHRDSVPFFKRLKAIHKLCREMNKRKYKYPGTCYCRLITLPVRLNFALVIDVMAWKLTH